MNVDTSFLLNLVVVIGGSVYVVAKIEASVERLSRSIDKLELAVEKMDGAISNHELRITNLESLSRN